MSKRRDVFTALLGATVAVILWLTILSRDANTDIAFYPPLHTFRALTRNLQRGIRGNLLGNIALFIPFGALFPSVIDETADARRSGAWKTIATGAALSILIEITQLITHRGVCDLDDIILNTVGTAVGYGLNLLIRKMMHTGLALGCSQNQP